MLLHNPFLPLRAVAAGMGRDRIFLLTEQAPSCFGHAPGEPLLLKRGDSKVDHIHLPRAYSLPKAKLTALAHSQLALAERGVPLSELVGLSFALPGDPLSVPRGPASPHVVPKRGTGVSGRARAGRWERNSPLLPFLPLISAGLDFFLITKSKLQAKSACSRSVLLPCGAGGGCRGGLALSNSHMSPQYAVVKIVREKYLKTTAFESEEQFQAFLSELYEYLVDQMHVALNQVEKP